MKLGIVILNYLNWEDTVECIDSIYNQTYGDLEIVVVDNNSKNRSIENIKGKIIADKKRIPIHFLQSDENLGFAKGNNLGIHYCINKLNISNVFVVNNDTIFKEFDYFEKLVKVPMDKTVGAIGTRIVGSDGNNQNPIYFNPSLKSVFRELIFPIIETYRNIKRFVQSNRIEGRKEKDSKKDTTQKSGYILHGAAILLTENYLNKATGFYPKTFLYYEENILGLIFKKMNLKMIYLDDIEIYHKEDQSSTMSFNNQTDIKYKYGRKSVKEALKLYFLSKEKIQKIINQQNFAYRIDK
ncbi:glycosyltransferase family 2 protein [Lacticigenium naphthae]|uniref:glycosyltransferase family 2 protein n=1 Tax=Lacticigenium naphthae TaxID=515351 RepID=UPI0004077084|nr:glycosyltransferase family 2 protein [Lacticigenium naphthae]